MFEFLKKKRFKAEPATMLPYKIFLYLESGDRVYLDLGATSLTAVLDLVEGLRGKMTIKGFVAGPK